MLARGRIVWFDCEMAKKSKTLTSKERSIDESIMASEEFQKASMVSKLNWLRAGVLGANDGIASTAGMVMGVAGADPTNTNAILIAGIASLVAGSISMAGGEYTSVSAQRDSELASLAKERVELATEPEKELRELALFYEQKGLSFETAMTVAEELTKKDALKAHAEAELGIELGNHASPTQAALSSFIAFSGGSLLPLLAVLAPPADYRIQVTVVAVVFALALTGWIGSKIGGARPGRAMLRNVIISAATMGITYGIGMLVGKAL